MRNEPFFVIRPVEISASEPRTSNAEFARNTHR
jgi:hypothetical protein